MKIRDSISFIDDEKQEKIEIKSNSIDIINEQGKALFTVRLVGGTLEVSGGDNCNHNGETLSSGITIKPIADNFVKIIKDKIN